MIRTQQNSIDNTSAAPVEPRTWDNHVLIPITQNLLGGAAVGALGFIGVIAYTGATSTATVDLYNAGVWCTLAGGIVACTVTIVRFFGDDLGIVVAAYNAGWHSRDPQIAALELELRAAYDAQGAAQSKGAAATISERQRQMLQAQADAVAIVKVAFQGDSYSRDAMKGRNMGQRSWERANWLLKAAGVMDDNGTIIAATPKVALQAIDEKVQAALSTNDKFVTEW